MKVADCIPSDTLKHTANRPGAVFMDFEQDTVFINHPETFRGMLHLNRNGSEKYSAKVARRIKKFMNSGRS